jgi:quinoprotein glucose dehydrogenase
VRAWDARTGQLKWSFDPIPQDSTDPAFKTWDKWSAPRTGGGNVWSVIVADPARDLVFLPTSSPAPDYFGGMRLGENRYTNSIVALRASTAGLSRQAAPNLWDCVRPPALATVTQGGVVIPVVIQVPKTGMMYVLDRTSGKPVFGVEERPVPASSVPGEQANPTQPFTTVTPPLSPLQYSANDAWGPTPEAQAACRALLGSLRNDGPFTPPSLQGTLVVPGNIGGAAWGGVAIDESRSLAIVPVNRLPAMVQLFRADGFNGDSIRAEDARRGLTDFEYTRMRGTPYIMRRRLILGPTGLPCVTPPFGSLVAVSRPPAASSGTFRSARWVASPARRTSAARSRPRGIGIHWRDARSGHRAFDIETGRELWKADLPAGARRRR